MKRILALCLSIQLAGLPVCAQSLDGLNTTGAVIYNSPADLWAWTRTTAITAIQFTPGNVSVDFDKRTGPTRWPDVLFHPGLNTDTIQYTVGFCLQVNGTWDCAGGLEFWFNRDTRLTTDLINLFYDTGRWGPIVGHQPAQGESVGVFVGAGDLRGVQRGTSVLERSAIVVIPWGTNYNNGTPGPPVPPIPPPVVPPPGPVPTDQSTVLQRLDQLSIQLESIHQDLYNQTERGYNDLVARITVVTNQASAIQAKVETLSPSPSGPSILGSMGGGIWTVLSSPVFLGGVSGIVACVVTKKC
jgi:hypothetical protein